MTAAFPGNAEIKKKNFFNFLQEKYNQIIILVNKIYHR